MICHFLFPDSDKGSTVLLPLLALALGAFGLGTTETIVMGLLPELSGSLGVSIAQTGLLVSGYAIGVTVASPVIAILTRNYTRRATLLLMMGLFVLGNAFSAIAPNYWLLMAARIITSLSHGTFYGAASVMASQLVTPDKRANALSLVYIGLTLSMILGVPLGTLIAQYSSWRLAFGMITMIGLISWGAIYFLIPQDKMSGPTVKLYAQLEAIKQPLVLTVMLVSMFTSASMFALFTYITPFLQNRIGLSPHGVALVLLLIGIGLCLGNLLGGRLADWKMLPSCAGMMLAVAIVELALVPGSRQMWHCIILLFLWGMFIYAPMAPLQSYVVTASGASPNIASAVNQSSFNFGNAVGAWAGSLIISAGASYAEIPVVAAAFAIGGCLLVCLAMRLEKIKTPL